MGAQSPLRFVLVTAFLTHGFTSAVATDFETTAHHRNVVTLEHERLAVSQRQRNPLRGQKGSNTGKTSALPGMNNTETKAQIKLSSTRNKVSQESPQIAKSQTFHTSRHVQEPSLPSEASSDHSAPPTKSRAAYFSSTTQSSLSDRFTEPGKSYKNLFCGQPSCLWVKADQLFWWTKGMNTPPLVTMSDPNIDPDVVNDPTRHGVLGDPATRVLFGQGDILRDLQLGGRLRGGIWLDCCRRWLLEGEFFGIDSASEGFRQTGFDHEILARPFINRDPSLSDLGVPAAELVSSPAGGLGGAVSVNAETSLWSAGIRLRRNLCCNEWACQGCDTGYNRRDFICGYRVLKMVEHLGVREELNSLSAPVTHFDLRDDFDTSTEFHGFEFGYEWEWKRAKWSLELLTKVAIGNNHQRVTIRGETLSSDSLGTTARPGGLLTQNSNLGSYERNRLSLVPELGVTAGYQITNHLRFHVGYSLISWSKVVRPGDQIDLNVDGQFLLDPNMGTIFPQFNFQEDHFWAQGLHLGFDFRI